MVLSSCVGQPRSEFEHTFTFKNVALILKRRRAELPKIVLPKTVLPKVTKSHNTRIDEINFLTKQRRIAEDFVITILGYCFRIFSIALGI